MALQTRWGYAWTYDERRGRADLFVRNLSVLNTLADGDMGAELPETLVRHLPRLRAAAAERNQALAAAGVPPSLLTLPHAVVMRGNAVEHFEILDEWDALMSRLILDAEAEDAEASCPRT